MAEPADASDTTRPSRLPQIPGYHIERLLGRGGMGIVYLARDMRLGRQVAIKMLTSAANASPRLRDRFVAECRAVAMLQHPNIAQLYAADELDGHPYFVMEYIDGPTLEESVKSHPLEPREAARVVRILAQAMAYSHEQGILHRDLKPSNILLAGGNTPMIADFGLAKVLAANASTTRTGEVLGTPGYMAPEQASGVIKSIGPPCDVYGLGAILYKLLTGRPPFDAPDPVQTVMMVLSDDPVPPRRLQKRVPRDLETIALHALEKQPSRRYPTAGALADDLNRFLSGRSIKARPTSTTRSVIKWTRRHPGLTAMAATLVIAVVGAFWGLSRHTSQLNAALGRTERLVDYGSDFAMWVVDDHLPRLREMELRSDLQLTLVSQVQSFLDEASQEVEPDVVLVRRMAISYGQLGDVLGNPNTFNLGRTREAIANYEHALRLFEQALELAPQDLLSQAGYVQCLLKYSDVILATEGIDAAEAQVKLAEQRLAEIRQPNSSDVKLLELNLLQRRAELALQRNRFDDALQLIDQSERAATEFAVFGDEEESIEFARYWGVDCRARVLERQGRHAEARKLRDEAVALARAAYERQPANATLRSRLAETLVTLGDSLTFLEKPAEALECYEEALPLRREQVLADPYGASSVNSLAVCLSRVADAWGLQFEHDKMVEPLEEAISLQRRLVATEPANRQFQRSLAIEVGRLGNSLVAQNILDDARPYFDEQLNLTEWLCNHPAAEMIDHNLYAEACYNLGVLEFLQWLTDSVNSGATDVEKLPSYQRATELFAKGVAAFDRVSSFGPLSVQQQNMRDGLLKMQKQAKDALEAFKQSADPGAIY